MKKAGKIILFGVLSWLVPFVVSFFMYSKDGRPLVDIFLFQSIMVVIGSLTATTLLVFYFKKIKEGFMRQGVILGLSWLAINWILDLVILIPMSKMSLSSYFMQIGLGYLVIPIACIGFGVVLENSKK